VYALTNAMYFGAVDAQEAAVMLGAMRAQAAKVLGPEEGSKVAAAARALQAFEKKAAALEGQRPSPGAGGRGAGGGGRGAAAGTLPPDTLWAVSGLLAGQMNTMQAADVAPTANMLAAVNAALQASARVMARWQALKTVDLPALNAMLKAAGLEPIIVR
jgi:hypothetical protein